MMRLVLASLSETCLTGICLFFVRTKVDAVINPKNIHEVRIIIILTDSYIFRLHYCEVQD